MVEAVLEASFSLLVVVFSVVFSVPNPKIPCCDKPSLALCPANFANRANLKKGLKKTKNMGISTSI